MKTDNKKTGEAGEGFACDFLERKGYRILHRNFRCKFGEIDVVARDGRTIAFVEVRTRCGSASPTPAETILWKKKNKLILLANFYIIRFGLKDESFRFDVVSVTLTRQEVNIELIKDAFWEA